MNVDDKVPAIVKNEMFYAFARVCMVLVATIGVPVLGFTLNRVVEAADKISDQLQKQNVAIILLSTEVKFRFSSIDDHESRLRKLEHTNYRPNP